jgi:hypothetical protein
LPFPPAVSYPTTARFGAHPPDRLQQAPGGPPGAFPPAPAFGGFREAGENAQQSGFASAVAAEQGDCRAPGDLNMYLPEGRKIAVVFPNTLDFESVQAAPFL